MTMPTDPDQPVDGNEPGADKNPDQGPGSPHGQGQDPSTDVYTPAGGSSASAAVGNTSTDSESRTDVVAGGGHDKPVPLAPSPQ